MRNPICFVFATLLVLQSIVAISQGRELANSPTKDSAKQFPCPSDEGIDPCTCWYQDTSLFLDCTEVPSEERLAEVFQQDFPVKDFDTFYINTTNSLVNLDFDLNGVTFRKVKFSDGIYDGSSTIETISAGLFAGSVDTLEILRVRSSNLTTEGFPFSSLSQYTRLRDVTIDGSNVETIPKVESSTLEYFGIQNSKVISLSPGKTSCDRFNFKIILLEF